MRLRYLLFQVIGFTGILFAAEPPPPGPVSGNGQLNVEYKDGALHATGFPPGTELKDAYTGRIGIVQDDGTVKEQPSDTRTPKAPSEPAFLSLPDSKVILEGPDGWTIKDKDGEIGMYSPDQPAKGLKSRIHISRYLEKEKTLEAAIDAEIDRVTARAPKWGSSNDRRSYKGSTPIKTESGMQGLRADFYNDLPTDNQHGRFYNIIKYYFFDEGGKIFRVCSHVYGDESRFKEYDQAIIEGLKFNKK